MKLFKVLFFLVLFSTQFQSADAQIQKEHLIAWWNFDDSTATDFSGYGRHGTMMNNPVPVPGINGIGTALRLSGGGYDQPTGAHVVLPMIDFNKFEEFTVSMWVYEENMDPWLGDAYIWFGEWDKGFLAIMNHYDQHQENDLSLRYLRLSFTVGGHGDHANERIVVPYDSTNWRNNWVNYVMTYNRDTIRAYVDGVQIGQNIQHVSVGGNTAGLNRHWWNNANTSCTRMNGIMDDVRIYNIKLSDTEVDSLKNDILQIQGTDFCEGESTELFATEGFDSYKWSTGDTTRIITVDVEGTYTVTVKKVDIELSTSFEVHTFPSPAPIIQGKQVFDNDEFYIDVKQNYSFYKWDTGEETKYLLITKSGTYGVTVTDENGCVGYEEFVIIDYLEIDGADFCAGGTAELVATPGYDSYEWSTGDTTRIIIVDVEGTYTVTGKKGDIELSDSFEVHIFPSPEPIIQGEHVFDNDDEFYINVKQNYSLYKWDTGEKTKYLHITKSGTYGVTVTDENGCVGYEEFVIIDLLEIDGADFCEGDTVELLATTGYDSYEWSTGDTTESISVNTGGKYFVSAKFLGEEYSISFDVTMHPLPIPIIEGDLILLENEEGDIYVQQDFDTYLWDSGEKTKSIHITEAGYYGVTVTDENGCTGYVKIEVKSTCSTVYAYADFKASEHLDFVGKAQKRDSVIHLTRSMLKEAGGIWIDDKVNVADGFTASFAFRLIDGHDASIPEASPAGADGIAFVIQNSEKNALGRIASAMGYAGIKNSIAIEYDAFCNDDLQITSNNDPNGSHVAIQSAGLDMNTQVHGDDVTLAMAEDIPEFVADGRKYYSKIEYNSADKRLSVYIDTLADLVTPVIVKENFDLSTLLDLELGKQAWIGLTAATGDGRQVHELVDLYICLYGPTVGVDESVQILSNDDSRWNPNPAADAASLSFRVNQAAHVELSVFNISGLKIATILSEYREAGQYKQNFDMSNLLPGVYISILKIGSERVVNKIIKTY